MIESLKNTCVLPESQEQARVIVALYEAAGGKVWNGSKLPKWDYRPIGIFDDGDILHADTVSTIWEMITFDELCWNYGIAPDWANQLAIDKNGDPFWFDLRALRTDRVDGRVGVIKLRELKVWSTRPAKQTEKQWPAPGTLPPVGVECESRIKFSSELLSEWQLCTPSYFGEKWCVAKTSEEDEFSILLSDIEFRPIQSERDRLVEQALKLDCEPTEGMLSRRDFVGAMYDAGMLKEPTK